MSHAGTTSISNLSFPSTTVPPGIASQGKPTQVSSYHAQWVSSEAVQLGFLSCIAAAKSLRGLRRTSNPHCINGCLQAASPFPGNEGVESDRDSDAGQGEQPLPPSKSSPKVKETVAGRAEQRRTRKREKVTCFTRSLAPIRCGKIILSPRPNYQEEEED